MLDTFRVASGSKTYFRSIFSSKTSTAQAVRTSQMIKITKVIAMVGTPRCGVRSAQRAGNCLASQFTERLPKLSGRSSRTQLFASVASNDKPCHSGTRRRRGISQLQVAPPSCRKACIAFERSFGALRQPQDDNVEGAIPIYRHRSK